MAETQVPQTFTVSNRFCAVDSDISFQSSDGVLFKVHRKNLENTKDLVPTGTQGAIVPLPEISVTLDLLFQLVDPQLQTPKLEGVDFAIVAALAEAAEKYKFPSAMNACKIQMRALLPIHPFGVLNYGGKHRYLDIADRAAPFTLDMPLKETIDELGPSVAIPWIKYCGEWLAVRDFAYNWSSTNQHACGERPQWSDVRSETLLKLGRNIGSLRDLDFLFPVGKQVSSCCENDLALWRKAVEERVQQIRVFSTFLSPPSSVSRFVSW